MDICLFVGRTISVIFLIFFIWWIYEMFKMYKLREVDVCKECNSLIECCLCDDGELS